MINTSLYSLYTYFFECLSESLCDDTIKHILENKKHMTHLPTHLNKFLEILENYLEDHDINNVVSELLIVYSMANDCNLCAHCINCSKNFYFQIVKLLINKNNLCEPDGLKKLDISAISDNMNFHKIAQNLLPHLQDKTTAIDYYLQKIDITKSLRKFENIFINLKGMSSSTPAIYNGLFEQTFTGGGLFILWKGFGIVIDPGYNFLQNFHEMGFTIEDINAVIVTHNHLDHTSDIMNINDFNYQLNSGYKKNGRTEFPHKIQWYLDLDSSKMYTTLLSETKSGEMDLNDIFNIAPYINNCCSIAKNISLSIIPTKHIVNNRNTFGCLITLFDEYTADVKKIGYTSDTAWFDKLSSFFQVLIF